MAREFAPEEGSTLKREFASADDSQKKGTTLGEKAGALAYGGATGLAGGLGELEKFAAYDVPEMVGLREKGKRDQLQGRETIFPTVKESQEILSKVGIEKPRKELSGYQTAGEILGGFGTSLPSIARTGAKALLGAGTKTSEALAKEAEKLGFKLSPAQVRADVPVSAKGATGWSKENQSLANELAAKGTGAKEKVSEITAPFIAKRLSDLGKEYDKIYKGKIFNIDKDAVDAINQIRAMESQLPNVAAVSPVSQVADDIVRNFERLATREGAKPNTFGIDGEAVQRIRNALSQRARSTNRGDAHEIYNLIDKIDASIAKNHKDIAGKLDVLRPQYRNSVILEDLYRQGGIKQGNISLERLGTMLRGKRDAVRKGGQDIDELGELGRELGLRARWETAGRGATGGEDVVGKLLGTGTDIASTLTGTRSRPARAIQRSLGPERELTAAERAGLATAAGTLTRPIQHRTQ
jgi:hypothetical protein